MRASARAPVAAGLSSRPRLGGWERRADDVRHGLLDPPTLAAYDGLTLHVRRGMGERPGDRRFPGRPQSGGIELEAYSPYNPGDDLRYLDWNAVGRLDALLVRRFVAEREVTFHVLVDTSASMTVPARDGKFGTALELAMALAYIALSANDAVRIALLAGDDGRPRTSPVYRQRVQANAVADVLAGAEAAGALHLDRALEAYAAHHPQPGAALVISDLMMPPGDVAAGIAALHARRYEVHLLHVVGESELDPRREFSQAVLADAESDASHPMVLTPATLARYQTLLAAHFDALQAVAADAEAGYARLATGSPVGTFVTTELARTGLVRRR